MTNKPPQKQILENFAFWNVSNISTANVLKIIHCLWFSLSSLLPTVPLLLHGVCRTAWVEPLKGGVIFALGTFVYNV